MRSLQQLGFRPLEVLLPLLCRLGAGAARAAGRDYSRPGNRKEGSGAPTEVPREKRGRKMLGVARRGDGEGGGTTGTERIWD